MMLFMLGCLAKRFEAQHHRSERKREPSSHSLPPPREIPEGRKYMLLLYWVVDRPSAAHQT